MYNYFILTDIHFPVCESSISGTTCSTTVTDTVRLFGIYHRISFPILWLSTFWNSLFRKVLHDILIYWKLYLDFFPQVLVICISSFGFPRMENVRLNLRWDFCWVALFYSKRKQLIQNREDPWYRNVNKYND